MSFWSNWVGGWGASSRFEKHRLLFTNKGDLGIINQSSLKKMMITFLGEDPETRAEIGLAIILRKINDSDSNTSWIYLLKNLIILDSALEEGVFTEQLSSVDVPVIYNFKVVEKAYIQYNFDVILKKYLKLIKFKASIMDVGISLFKAKAYKRQELTNNLNVYEINWHLDQCEELFSQVFDLVQHKQPDIIEFQSIKYLFYMLKNKLITSYSIEMLCISHMLSLLQNQTEADILTFKKRIAKFNSNEGYTIAFFQEFKLFKGFENLNYKQFNFNYKEVLAYVEEVLKVIRSKQQAPKHIKVEQYVTEEKLTIVKKINCQAFGKPNPRLKFMPEKTPRKQVFETYFNTYSEDFPPKELLTQEINQILRSAKQEDDSEDEEALALERSNVLSIYNLEPFGKQGIESKDVALQYREVPPLKNEFANIYSKLEAKWVN